MSEIDRLKTAIAALDVAIDALKAGHEAACFAEARERQNLIQTRAQLQSILTLRMRDPYRF